jgi:hypothetical protein
VIQSEDQPDGGTAKRVYRPSLTLLAVLAPIVTPLLFALLGWTGLFESAEKLSKQFGGSFLGDPMIMFMWGWIGLTIACGGWIAWRIVARIQGALRWFSFVGVWLIMTAVLGAAGAAVGIPACLPSLH